MSTPMKELIAQIEPMIPALRRYARALLRETELADDLVQDCLERVIGRWSQRRPGEEPRPWAFSILHNLAIDSMRRRARRGVHLAIDDVDEHEMAVPGRQEDGLVHAELMRALDALPPDQRSVVLMVSVEDMTYAEAADALGIPLGTVMSRLSRGRERLQKALDGELDKPVRTAGAPPLRRLK
jgi:RNA polymerase sigma-70 factor (ECF subfamily)